ncbi:MAG: hypothetical protein H0W08_02990 [Acidobacteria bacterium]|nr:hypothetical protein [Acidobacteriota bacterium]
MGCILPESPRLAYCSGMERARFGMFDFSPSTGELRRNGIKIRLQAQPAKVLAALVTGRDNFIGNASSLRNPFARQDVQQTRVSSGLSGC